VKVGVWCAVSARRIVVPMVFNETVNYEGYLHAAFSTPSVICEL
jgi:hypothetical protein